MVFLARQMIEKCREQNAYNSVPRLCMWNVLEKYGIPPNMLSVIRSFHKNMLAKVQVGEVTTRTFS